MRLYLGDNITDRRVVAQLQRMGHAVLLPVAIRHSGGSDAKHLAYAIREGYARLTQNYEHCEPLHLEVAARRGAKSRHPLAGMAVTG